MPMRAFECAPKPVRDVKPKRPALHATGAQRLIESDRSGPEMALRNCSFGPLSTKPGSMRGTRQFLNGRMNAVARSLSKVCSNNHELGRKVENSCDLCLTPAEAIS